MTVRALRCTAQRIQLLAAEAAELEVDITQLVRAAAPWLRAVARQLFKLLERYDPAQVQPATVL